jgi:hypothetical protein
MSNQAGDRVARWKGPAPGWRPTSFRAEGYAFVPARLDWRAYMTLYTNVKMKNVP